MNSVEGTLRRREREDWTMTIIGQFRIGALAVALALTSGLAAAEEKTDIQIGLASGGFATVAPRLCKELGLYDKYGLTPRFVIMDSASATTTAIISRSIPVGLSGPGELVVAQAKGIDIVAISNAYGGMGGVLTLSNAAAAKAGVSPAASAQERLKALDGLLIASTTPTSSWTLSFKSAAEAAGAKVRFTFMAQTAMQAAMEAGSVDGFVSGAPYWAGPVLQKTGVVWVSGPKGDLPFATRPAASGDFQAMRSYAEANPKVIAGVVGAHKDLAEVIKTRPDDVIAALEKIYPELDKDTIKVLFESERIGWSAGELTVDDMKHEIQFIKMAGKVGAEADSLDPRKMLFP
jgi:ABC-type nitrate/sulfonate/bicarbonate transport system substrate-binding protein